MIICENVNYFWCQERWLMMPIVPLKALSSGNLTVVVFWVEKPPTVFWTEALIWIRMFTKACKKISYCQPVNTEHFLCRFDYVNISDGNNFIGRYCGSLTGQVIFVSLDYLVLTFHSDGIFDPDKRGFEIFFAGDVNTPGKWIQKSTILHPYCINKQSRERLWELIWTKKGKFSFDLLSQMKTNRVQSLECVRGISLNISCLQV